MPTYKIYGKVVGTKFLGEFEADTPEEAAELAKAADEMRVCICHECDDQISDAMVEALSIMVRCPHVGHDDDDEPAYAIQPGQTMH